MIPPQLLRRQPDPEQDCGLYALQNLYVWAGVEPPDVGVMRAAFGKLPGGVVTVGNAFQTLVGTRFPRFVSFGIIPAHSEALSLFPALLDEGCALYVRCCFRVGPAYYAHAAVAVGHSDRGLYCLDSTCPSFEGRLRSVESESDGRSMEDYVADYKATLPFCDYGARTWLPWVTMNFDEWEGFDGTTFVSGHSKPAPLGIDRAFLMVAPPLPA
ncbi:MAG: hypothetical protein ACJ754_10960 [Pyrinomonadaceae bacterium]